MKWRTLTLGSLMVAGLWAGCLSACPADIVGDICRLTPAQPHSFSAYLNQVRRLEASPRVAVSQIGRSREGRPLLQIMVRDPETPREETVRVYLLARQHGTEASGTEACLALLRHFARSEGELERELLRQITFVAVPVVNPDGMARGRRGNGGGADLNRDWARGSQPETRAVIAAVEQLRPHALVDMHELPAGSGKPSFRENFIQTIGPSTRLPVDLSRDCGVTGARLAAWMRDTGYRLNVYYDTPGEDRNLCHRYFGLARQVPSYLFEAKNGPGRSLLSRVRFQVLGALVVGNYALHRHYVPVPEMPLVAVAPALEPPLAAAALAVVELQQPQDRQTARGELPVVAQVTPSPQLAYLQLRVNGQVRAMINSAPHEFRLDTRRLPDGEHRVTVQACDDSGRVLCEAGATILVHNQVTAGQ